MSTSTVQSPVKGRRIGSKAGANYGRAKERSALPYLEIFRAGPVERIKMARAGVPASRAKQMIEDLHLDQGTFLDALNLKRATVNRKAARNQLLALDESERVLGVAKLVGQLDTMLQESGDPQAMEQFDQAEWLATWLRNPLPALGGVPPITMLDTIEGQQMVSHALAMLQSGAYS